MDLPVLTRVAHDGEHQLTFRAAVLASATTRRPGAERWTELTVYRTQVASEEPPQGLRLVAKVGRSLVAHRQACPQVSTRGMPRYAEDPRATDRFTPCRFCLPILDPPAGDLVVERTKRSLQRCRTVADLGHAIFPRVQASELRGMTLAIVSQLRHADPDFDTWWASAIAPRLDWT